VPKTPLVCNHFETHEESKVADGCGVEMKSDLGDDI